jgi:hypothetical protein
MVVGMVPYVMSVIEKKTILNHSSWIIWSTIGIINFVAYASAGEKETLWFVGISALNPTILFFMSLKYGVKKWLATDTYCLLLAAAAIIIWKVTGNPVLALAAGLVADSLGIVPVVCKVIKEPFTENLTGWSIGLLASFCNLIAVKEWTWANSLYTIYSITGFLVIVVTLVRGQYFRKTASG